MDRIIEDHFFLIGISNKTAPVEIRENFSFSTSSIGPVASAIKEIPGVEECVLISTCNRTEIYLVINISTAEIQKNVNAYILKTSGAKKDILSHFYYIHGIGVIEHLFKVSSGLDSMIIGEPQITGQVKNAFAIASDFNCTGPTLNRLFHNAFRVGKTIRSLTAIGEGAVSVSYATVQLSRKIFKDLEDRSVLLIGAGETAELCASSLKDLGVDKLYITNRTHARAVELAKKLGGEAIPFDQLLDMIGKVDITITSVMSLEPIIKNSDIVDRAKNAANHPLFFIDLGVPRNIDPSVAEQEGIHLYNIDDLEDVTTENLGKREKEVGAALAIVDKEVQEYSEWFSGREVIPVIRDLRCRCESIREQELEKIKFRVDQDSFEMLDIVTRRILRKLLHNPIITMRASESGEEREKLLESVRDLFIKDPEE